VHKDKKLLRLVVVVPSAHSEEPECCFGKFIQKARRCAQQNGWCNRTSQQQGQQPPCPWVKRRPLLIGAFLFMLFCKFSFTAFFFVFLAIAACKIARKLNGGHCGNNARGACSWARSPAPIAAAPQANNNTNSVSTLNQSRSGNTKFEQMLASLEDMGFVERTENIRALVETRGDLTEAVVRLTAQRH